MIIVNCLPCNERFFETGMVCVCNSSYCDTLEFVEPTKIGDVLIFSSSEKGLRFLQSTAKFERSFRFRKHIKLKENLITIDRSKKYQKIIGFGNAMSGAAAINLDLLSVELRNHVFQSYFNKDIGLAFNILRTPIGGTDSDVAPWAYNETPENDTLLSNFNKLDQRDEIKVRFFKDIKNVTNNTDIKYFGATWTPPRWMKSNNNYTGFSYLKPEFYETYALYHIKWLELMRKAGIEFWSISTGNEPMNGNVFSFGAMLPSLGWDPITQGFWIAKYFGPMMNKAFPDIKLVSTDDQIFTFPIWFNAMYGTIPESKSYIKGHVFHYYANVLLGRKALTETYNLYPDKFIILTEAAHGVFPWEDVKGPVLGSWQRAENYIVDIIDGLNNYLNGWIDWNMIMNDFGGPVYTELFADCTIIKSKGDKFPK
jgi:glucosylceramidase